MRYYIFLIAFLPALITSYASGAEVPQNSTNPKLEKLIDVMQIDQIVAQYAENCIDGFLASPDSPEGFAKDNKLYYGFSSSSPEWESIIKAYSEYSSSVCTYLDPEKVEEEFYRFFVLRLEDKDIDRLAEFYGTDSGQKFIRVHREMNRHFREYYMEQSESHWGSAEKIYKDKLREIGSRAKRRGSWWRFWK